MSYEYGYNLIVTGRGEELERFYEENRELEGEGVLDFGRAVPEPADIGDESYSWRMKHWGCSFIWWANVEKENGVLDYVFETNWSCMSWLEAVSQKYPNLKFVLYDADMHGELKDRHTYKGGFLVDYNSSWWWEGASEVRINPPANLSRNEGWISFTEGKRLTDEMHSPEETCIVEFRFEGQSMIIGVKAGYGEKPLDIEELVDLYDEQPAAQYEQIEAGQATHKETENYKEHGKHDKHNANEQSEQSEASKLVALEKSANSTGGNNYRHKCEYVKLGDPDDLW